MEMKAFVVLRGEIIKTPNKVGYLIDSFRLLHADALPEDLNCLNSRMAGIYKHANHDYMLVLQAIWKSAADNISGLHLNYIDAMVLNRKGIGYGNRQSEGKGNVAKIDAKELLNRREKEHLSQRKEGK